MIVRSLTLLALLLPCCCISAQEKKGDMKFNFGAKIGFQAVAYSNPQFGIEGYDLDCNNLHSDRIGYSIAPFARLIKSRFYIQIEAAVGLARHSFEFIVTDNGRNNGILPNSTEYNLTALCLQLPVIAGYNIIDEGKYAMSIFTGPMTKFVFTAHDKQEFKHFAYNDLEEKLKKRCYYWEFGLGVKIGNMFFDFIYDWGISKVSEYIISKSDGKKFSSYRKDNIFSFSVGMIF